MKRVGKLVFCLAGGLALNTGVRADDAALPGGPYTTVVTRNIFGLNPPPPPSAVQDDNPPPKITPNGIMTIFGEMQVLFKVAGTAKPGVPAVDQSYILSEGQRQDDIEVVKIDEKAGLVTFDNHGETQQLPLVVASANATSSSSPSFGPGGHYSPGFVNPSGGGVPRPRAAGYGSAGYNPGYPGNGGNGAGPGGLPYGSNLEGGPARKTTFNAADQVPPDLKPDEQAALIELNRLQAQQQGNPDAAKILPITDLTPSDSGNGGDSSQPQ